jgi:D-alanine-D-alanine ligase
MMKTRGAVFFGGRSPEHDVSIVTGLQALAALDGERFSSFPVYVSTEGEWFLGDALRDRVNYLPKDAVLKSLEPVTLATTPTVDGQGRLIPLKAGGLFSKPKTTEFDVALLAFHGLSGEDGRMQGLFEIANVPYTGMRPLASSVLMDKAATKLVLGQTSIALLPSIVINRPATGLLPDAASVSHKLAGWSYPVIVKPLHLGSSIGVAKAHSLEEVRSALSVVFRLDTHAIVEPFVENLVEYNVAVRNGKDGIETSAIERPKAQTELLDFKAKYLAGGAGGSKSGSKQPGAISQGMLSLTRELNPVLPPEFEEQLRRWAVECFATVYGTGAPRIDFLCNSQTGQFWLNEVNPCPGSFGYFLWEAGERPLLFTELLTALIDEGLAAQRSLQLPPDPTHPEARLFTR